MENNQGTKGNSAKLVQQSFQNSPQPVSQAAPSQKPARIKPIHIQKHRNSSGVSKAGIVVLAIVIMIFLAAIMGAFGTPTSTSNPQPAATAEPKGAWLTDLRYSDKDSGVYENRSSNSHGSDGNGYNHYLSGHGVIIYPLHNMYSALSARWVLDADWPSANADAGALLIYTDDVLAFSSSSISIEGNMYQDVYVDVSGCDYLKIEFSGYHYLHYGFSTYGNIGRLNNIWLDPYSTSSDSHTTNASLHQNVSSQESIILSQGSQKIQLLPSVREALSYDQWSTVKDPYGNEYSGPYFDFCSYHENGRDPHQSYVILRPNGNWERLRGRYFTRTGQDSSYRISFQIYADDILIYDSGEMGRDDYPVDFDIDINRADKLKLISYSDNYTFMGTNPGIILVNAEVYN